MRWGKLKEKKYINRIVDSQLARQLDLFGAVEVAGTMWCGKTWTSLAFANSVSRIGLAGPRSAAEADPATALIGSRPHLIDEWQDVPEIWDEVRATVDSTANASGSFILTGSAEPNKHEVHHSGAGRISKLRMSTMTLQETGLSTGTVSLAGLFEGRFEPKLAQQRLQPLAEAICKGGWPFLVTSQSYSPDYLDSYFEALFDVSVPRKGLSGSESRKVAVSLARNLGSAAKLSTIAEDAQISAPNAKVAAEKVSTHISALEQLYVIEQLKGWDAPIRSKSRVRTKPKRYFADPSLAANLLQITPERLLNDGQLFGLLFESLAIHDLNVYARALQGAPTEPLRYYRDSDNLEVDVIVELRDGRWAPIEIKLGDNKVPEGLANLNRLRRKIAANPAARNRKPSFSAVIVGTGEYARYDKEADAFVIPLTTLGP